MSKYLGLSRSRNLRKAEAAKKQSEAQKKLHAVATATVVPTSDNNHEVNAPSEEPKVKKKRYSIKVDTEPAQEVEGNEDNKSDVSAESVAAAGEALDPAEFARQERLRKQREKQVNI